MTDVVALRRPAALAVLVGALAAALALAVAVGSVPLSPRAIWMALWGDGPARQGLIVWNIRLPRAVAGALAGAILAGAGAVMQSLLRNPLASSFTLGISQGAAFGATIAIVLFGAGTVQRIGEQGVMISAAGSVLVCAFTGALATVAAILALTGLRRLTAGTVVLAGVAISSLFSAGTMFVQYFAADIQLAASIYWAFGDVGKAGWRDIAVMAAIGLPVLGYFIWRAGAYDALGWGEETALGLGVDVDQTRAIGLTLAALAAAAVTAYLGVIGFVGLIAPHMMRAVVGHDHRYLIPASALAGGLLLVGADLAARLVLAPTMLPVGIVTAFVGAPLFLYLLLRGDGAR